MSGHSRFSGRELLARGIEALSVPPSVEDRGYFAWPKGVTPAPFQIEFGPGSALTARADNLADGTGVVVTATLPLATASAE
jgi:hypothetical protein